MRGLVACVLLVPATAAAQDWYVQQGSNGDGSMAAPFGDVQAAVDVAGPGDVVHVAPGTYGPIQTRRAGMEGAPIRIVGDSDVFVKAAARVLTVSHPFHIFDKIIFDAQYADVDAVRIETAADSTTLRNCGVQYATRDCIDMGSPSNVVIDGCEIHHCLNAANGRTDAHGIVGAGVRDLTIRNTLIHAFSGDAVQFDPGRTLPAWDRITIEGCGFSLYPLGGSENGFPSGTVPGENAIDTKVPPGATSHLTIRNTTMSGFKDGLIGNMAALNLKEGVVADIDGVTIRDSEIAFRLRAPAQVRIQNAVVFNVGTGVRYEDNIVAPKLYNSTFGEGVTNLFVEASSPMTKIDAKNVLVLDTPLPPELSAIAGSMTVDGSAFVDTVEWNYRLVPTAKAVDRGVAIDVAIDRDGIARPQGTDIDVGAFEFCVGECIGSPDGGGGGGGGGGNQQVGGCCRAPNRGPMWPAFLVVAIWLRRRRVKTGPRRDTI